MVTLTRYLGWALLTTMLFVGVAHGNEVTLEYEVVSEGYKRELYVTENGRTYLIEPNKDDWYELYVYKYVHDIVDLDADGVPEAIIKTHYGGNCCGPTYMVVKRVREGFYALLTHDALSGFPKLTVRADLKPVLLEVMNFSEGAGNTSLEETFTQLALINGKLEVVAHYENTAMLAAEVEVTSEELSQLGVKELQYDLDADGQVETITCKYWKRWGAMQCVIQSETLGEVKVSDGCDRLGVLKGMTDGVHDLVCNRNKRISVFDE